ncbi:MAG: peptide chain release factor-like protein [Nitrospirae bacterium]|nr:peptide chain release factor-like protein [Nitrospirota bacterium]
MGTFPVSLQKEKSLFKKMELLGIREQDIEESFVRSAGKGGQNVNKTSTCVYLKHLPTEIEVKCQKERSQGLNRYHARMMLIEKIEFITKGKESEEARKIYKIRRQKAKRSKRTKEKILADKAKLSEKKQLRASVRSSDG